MIANKHHDDGYLRRGVSCRADYRETRTDNYVDTTLDGGFSLKLQVFGDPFGREIFNLNVLPNLVTMFAQTLKEPGTFPRRLSQDGGERDIANARDLGPICVGEAGEEGTGREDGRKDTRQQPLHSITLSARTRIDCGTLSPSSRATPRLISSLKSLGCSMGILAGLAPRRTLSTYTARRRCSVG